MDKYLGFADKNQWITTKRNFNLTNLSTPTMILPANPDRFAIAISCQGGGIICINLGAQANTSDGIYLFTNGAPLFLFRDQLGESIGWELWGTGAGGGQAVQGWEFLVTGAKPE